METKIRKLCTGSLITVAVLLGACRADRVFSDPGSIRDGEDVTASGVFDLKSICLNAGPQNKVSEDHCRGYLAESGEPTVRSAEIEIKICSDQLHTNCIEELPENAPPEEIVIRDRIGDRVGEWALSRAKLKAKTVHNKQRFEVMQID